MSLAAISELIVRISMHAHIGSIPTMPLDLTFFVFLSTQAGMCFYLKSTCHHYVRFIEHKLICLTTTDSCILHRADSILSAHDSLALGCITYLLNNSDKNRPIATILRTNSLAISVFRSLLDTDPLDALEDFLSRKRTQHVDIACFLASLEDAECDSTRLLSIFEVIGYSPLEYAVMFSPQRAMALLQDGANAAGDGSGTLFNAILFTSPHLIGPLLDAGADVNIRDWKGHTPLHWACSWCRYDEFFKLIRWAESDIDWRAHTRDGRNALDLFDSGVLEGFDVNHSQVELDEFRTVLVDHLAFDDDDDELDRSGEFRLDVPGAFPDVSC